jgi:uncharacterized damage-inducible protein DinB
MDYISARNREMQTTLKVLQAYPEAKVNLKPAEKSRTAAELAMIFAVEERVLKSLLETGATNLDFLRPTIPSTIAEIIAAFQQAIAANDAVLATLTPQQFDRPVNFYGMNISLGDALWFELFDHIHHRGQLSVYVRLAGAKLPSIYGPTADAPITTGASDQ